MTGKHASGIVWLASSDAEISRARTLLRSLTPQGVLDELGFLVLLGALSDRLYPAINTIMTRARYLVFVPAILRHIEERQLAKNRLADGVSRDFQARLCDALLATHPNERGIIGRDAGRSVARPPSNVYWNALADLGIASSRISEGAYLERLTRGHSTSGRHKDDDGLIHELGDDRFWDGTFPTKRALPDSGEFPKGTSFALTSAEARHLQRRYEARRPDGGTSLLTHLLAHGASSASARVEFAYPWDIPNLPSDLVPIVDHARRLSLFARGAQLQYHALLFLKKGSKDPGTNDAFEAWWRHAKSDLASWDLGEFARIPCATKALRLGDVAFFEDWLREVTSARSASSAYRSTEARARLVQREREVRNHKARLKGGFHLRTWIEPEFYDPGDFYALLYRHRTGTQFAIDITNGLRRGGQ
jgi:hypothetical protein